LVCRNKNSEESRLAAQPPTLAVFLPWGSSAGAGRMTLTAGKCTHLSSLIQNIITLVLYPLEMSKPTTVQEYIKSVPEDRIKAFKKLRSIIKSNIDPGFKECINYGMIGYVVPLSTYPDGYHCAKDAPLPFMNLANQKSYLAVYHSGVYADENLHKWFTKEYPKHAKYKLNMGKSCIRFKKMDDIPFDLIGELAGKMDVKTWISLYEKAIKR